MAKSGKQDRLDKQLGILRDYVFKGDNRAFFIDRETVLSEMADEANNLPFENRYSFLFEAMLDHAHTPILKEDVILGRMREEIMPEDWKTPNVPGGINSFGHMTPDYAAILEKGLDGIVSEAESNAKKLKDHESLSFARNARRCAESIRRFCSRYADAATEMAKKGSGKNAKSLILAANALKRVPFYPAETFFEALQSVWIIHLALSCYAGSRDFAFGRIDQWLLPYYRKNLEERRFTDSEMLEFMAHFLMKANEIPGTGAFNYRAKPVPCQSSKQYLVLGGCDVSGNSAVNELSIMILEAAERVLMPEPVICVRMNNSNPDSFNKRISEATSLLKSQIHFFNDDLIIPSLRKTGLPDEAASDYSMIGCCRVEIPGCMDGLYSYHYHNMPEWLTLALEKSDSSADMGSIISHFAKIAGGKILTAMKNVEADRKEQKEGSFHLESLFIRDCVAKCRDYSRGGSRYSKQGHFLGGIATVGNSLAAINQIVFVQKRFSLPQFLQIVGSDFKDNEMLRNEIRNSFPKFGNGDSSADKWAALAADAVLDEIGSIRSGDFLFTGFYSLDQHHNWGRQLPSTPDGRKKGEPLSENQSPVYGTDLNGVTALLQSVSSLPLRRTVMGGLNVKFGHAVPPQTIKSLIESYFKLGGIHLGFTFVDTTTLKEARKNPEQFRSLCVRLYGFSEYFVSLSPEEQEEIISRTENKD